jgi:signal transduction histidine kinase
MLAVWFASRLLARKLGGPVIRLATSVSDIAERAVSSDSIRPENYRGELRALAQTVKDMAHALETRVASQKRVLAAVSHELRTPLSRLKVISELLGTGRDAKGHLSSMDAEINELELLVSQLLDSSRLEFKALNWSHEDAVDLLRVSAKAAGLETNIGEVPAEPMTVRVDALLLRRALINVMRNALIHGAAPIELRVGRQAQEVCFDVVDSKGTLSASRFEAAVRGENVGDAKADGLGLGLHLAAGIAQALGGRLELVEGGPTRTCVRLCVPLVNDAHL